MINLPDTSDRLEEVFNNASRALFEMNENIEKMRIKFGEGSQFYQRQKFVFDCLVEMQDAAAKEITAMKQAYRLAEINQRAQQLIINSLQSGLSEKQFIAWATK
jgi:hypothetical protein